MNGLYALKPWYARRLRGLRAALVEQRVRPSTLSAAGVACGAAAGVALAMVPAGSAALAVAPLLAARLAFANLDGAVARDSGRSSPWGSVVNELGDRAAELAALAGALAFAPTPLVLAAAIAASAPSWVSLAGQAAGAGRLNGGPVGKTERALLLVVLAATGVAVPVLTVLAAGSLLTAALRLRQLHRALRISLAGLA